MSVFTFACIDVSASVLRSIYIDIILKKYVIFHYWLSSILTISSSVEARCHKLRPWLTIFTQFSLKNLGSLHYFLLVYLFGWLIFGKLVVIHSKIRHRIFVFFGRKVSMCAFFFSWPCCIPLLAIPIGFGMVLFIWKESACQLAVWWCVVNGRDILWWWVMYMECDVIGLYMILKRKD